MHILIIPSWYPYPANPASGIFIKRSVEALRKAGNSVGVIAPIFFSLKNFFNFSSAFSFGLCAASKGADIEIEFYGFQLFPDFLSLRFQRYIKYGKILFQKYFSMRGKPEIIHAHSWKYGGVIAASISRHYNIPFVITEHSSSFLNHNLSSTELLLAKNVFKRAKEVVFVSHHLENGAKKLIGANFKSSVIPNSVPNNFFLASPQKHFGIKALSIGEISENKGQERIIRAYASSELSKIPGSSLSIIGDGPKKSFCEKLALDLGLKNKVFFHGRLTQEEIIQELQRSDCLIVASSFETFGVVCLEAMAVGIPVISTKCGGPQEILTTLSGIFIEGSSPDAIRIGMDSFLLRKSDFDSYKIKQYCKNKFSEIAVNISLISIYERVLRESSKTIHP